MKHFKMAMDNWACDQVCDRQSPGSLSPGGRLPSALLGCVCESLLVSPGTEAITARETVNRNGA